jgi:hypothetical protein
MYQPVLVFMGLSLGLALRLECCGILVAGKQAADNARRDWLEMSRVLPVGV